MNMSIHWKSRLMKAIKKNAVSGFSPNTGKFHKHIKRFRNFTSKFLSYYFAYFFDSLSLGFVKINRLNKFLNIFKWSSGKGMRGGIFFK
jgi:hypothetical protein